MMHRTTSRALALAVTVAVVVVAALTAPTPSTAVHTPPLNPSTTGDVLVDGPLDCPSGWCVLAQACFGYDSRSDAIAGTANLTVTLADPSDAVDVRIYIYSDIEGAWEVSGDEDRSCNDRTANNKAANWNLLNSGTGFDVHTTPNKNTWTMKHIKIQEGVKPRFWYFVAANCDAEKGFKFQRFTLAAHDIASYHGHKCGEGDGVDAKKIAIIVVVVLLLLCVLSTTVYCCCCRKKKNYDLSPPSKTSTDDEEDADEMDALKGGRSGGGGGAGNGAVRSTNYDLDNNDDIDDLEEITEALQATRGDDGGRLNLEEVQLR